MTKHKGITVDNWLVSYQEKVRQRVQRMLQQAGTSGVTLVEFQGYNWREKELMLPLIEQMIDEGLIEKREYIVVKEVRYITAGSHFCPPPTKEKGRRKNRLSDAGRKRISEAVTERWKNNANKTGLTFRSRKKRGLYDSS